MNRRSWLIASSVCMFVAGLGMGCDRVIDQMIRSQAAAEPSIDASDGSLHVVLCGTGSPLPDPDRAAACTAVLAGGRFFIVDAGPGSWENIQVWQLPIDQLSGVFLTHFHSDHMGGLGETVLQSWVASGRGEPLPVYGPMGIEEIVEGFNRAYAFDQVYRTEHHGADLMPASGGRSAARPFVLSAEVPSVIVYDEDGLRVTAFSVDHAPIDPAVGYRFDYRGRSVVVSGDTVPSANLVLHAKDADLLIHEALSVDMMLRLSGILADIERVRLSKLAGDVLDYHTSPVQAKEIADEAGVGLLVLSHNVPPLRNAFIERLFTEGLDQNGVVIGDDGMHFTLPPESDRILQDSY